MKITEITKNYTLPAGQRMFNVVAEGQGMTVTNEGRIVGGMIGDWECGNSPLAERGELKTKPTYHGQYNWYLKGWVCPA